MGDLFNRGIVQRDMLFHIFAALGRLGRGFVAFFNLFQRGVNQPVVELALCQRLFKGARGAKCHRSSSRNGRQENTKLEGHRSQAARQALHDMHKLYCTLTLRWPLEIAIMDDVDQASIFTKIIKGQIPSHKIYEDNQTFAFMDIHPIQPGMVLVVTKRPAEDFTELTADELNALMSTVQRVAQKLKEVFPDKKRIGVMLEGLEVAHTHAKVFPIDSGDEFRAKPDMTAEPDLAALAELAAKLALPGS